MRKYLFFLMPIILFACSANTKYDTQEDIIINRRDRFYKTEPSGKKMPLSYHKKSIKKDSDGLVYFHCSYYGKKFAGKKTANGEIFDPEKLTCAHKTLPFGTKLRITDPDTGKSVIVRVNDRGPFVKGRDLDLSRAAAEKTGLINYGVKKMQVEILD